MLQIPKVGSEVTLPWLQKILQEHATKSNPKCMISVGEFALTSGSVAGDSFNSDLTIAEVKAKQKKDDESPEEEIQYGLYLKFHSLNSFTKEAGKFSKSHKREVLLYSEIFTVLMELQENEANGMYPLHIPVPFYSYAKHDDYVVVLENLKSQGYSISDKRKGLSYKHLELALKQLAHWHALSYVFNKRSNFLERFPTFKCSEKMMKFIAKLLEISVTNLVPLLEHNDEYDEMMPKIKNPTALMREFLNQILNRDETKVRCLLHGDFWNNNLLFKYDESSLPTDVKIIDWQMSFWGRPVVDIHYLLYSSTTYAVRQNHITDLLKLYHDTFHDITVTFNCKHPGYTFEAFSKEFMEASALGIVYGTCLSQGTLGKSSERINANETSSPRSLGFTLRCWVARSILPLLTYPSMGFIIKAISTKMLGPVGKEIKEGTNKILNERLLGLIVEMHQKGYLNSIPI